ncbi:MAG: ABC transporter ATP-binding protein [Vicinamibacterales bacterium]
MAASVFMAGLETAGMVSILPFMALVVDRTALTRYPILASLASSVGTLSWRETVAWAAAATATLVTAGNIARALANWWQWRFEARVRHRLTSDLMRAVLYAPYSLHVARDASSLMKVVGHDVPNVTGSVLLPLLRMASGSCVVLALLGLIVLQTPLVVLASVATIGGAYVALFRGMRRRQLLLGEQVGRLTYEWRLTSHEALGGIKELTVLNRREPIFARFSDADKRLADLQVRRKLTETLPRHGLETITFGCILAAMIVLTTSDATGATAAIPTLALFAFVAYRLMPRLQELYASALSVRYGIPSLRAVLSAWRETGVSTALQAIPDKVEPIGFQDDVCLHDVTFTYPGATRPALTGVTLCIRRGESIGLVGRTGAGKSTLADLLLGLFEPDSGSVMIDGVRLTRESQAAWRRRVGYVAQHVFLANATVSENIAFGLRKEDIDHDAVIEAARLAQVDSFIATLPHGYATVVGERGVRLSGGERQRIGIARALYRRPSILIFDEATSALDGLTQEAVMGAIQQLREERTVVIIAHRLRTLEACDRLVFLEAGHVVAVGSFDALTTSSEAFARFRSKS